MEETKIIIGIKAMLVQIHIITGWSLPENREGSTLGMRTILENQFAKKLTESCRDINFTEIEYAFRQYGTVTKDWGKNFSINMFSEVIDAYRAHRQQVSELERDRPKAYLPAPAMTDADYREWDESTRKLFQGGFLQWQLLPVSLYDWLEKTGALIVTKEEKNQVWKRALEATAQPDLSVEQQRQDAIALSKKTLLAKYYSIKS